jgi:hypothetical protein
MAKAQQQSSASIKQEREERRQAKVEAYKKAQAKQVRNRRIGIAAAIVGAVAVVAIIVSAVVVASIPKPDPATIEIKGLETYPGVDGGVHKDGVDIDYEAQYGTTPPAGGDHWSRWLNCGIYTEPQQDEQAVHALEHGAVWITYNPDEVSGGDLEKLQSATPDTYAVLSPYPGLDAPVVVSAWGAQVKLDGVDDERLQQFIDKYWQADSAPEPGAPCTGADDGPGKIG